MAAVAPPPVPAKAPLTVAPTAYLDPSSYALGPHPIQISSSALIHPRARLIGSHCPLNIGEGCIVTERCVVGGPAPASSITDPKGSQQTSGIGTPASEPPTALDQSAESGEKATTLGDKVHLHPSATVQHGAVIGAYSVVESHAQVLADVRVGEHSKICAGITVDRDVGDWEVVYGTGQRRKRQRNEEAESTRLRGLEGERNGTMAVLRAAQEKALMSKAAARRGK